MVPSAENVLFCLALRMGRKIGNTDVRWLPWWPLLLLDLMQQAAGRSCDIEGTHDRRVRAVPIDFVCVNKEFNYI